MLRHRYTRPFGPPLHACIAAIAGTLLVGCEVLFPDDGLDDGPAPDIVIGNSIDLGPIDSAPVIRGRSGGHSVRFDERSVWAFGDTAFGQSDENGLRVHGSSMSWTDDDDARDSISGLQEETDSAGVPRRFLPLTDDELGFNLAHDIGDCEETPCGARWAIRPAAMVHDEVRARVLVFYQKVYSEPGSADVEFHGASLAVWSDFELDPERPEFGVHDDPTLLFAADEPAYGAAALIVGDFLYAYGVDVTDEDKPCTLARAPIDQVLDRAAWRFRNDDGDWVTDVALAEPLFGSNDLMHVSFNAHVNAYLAIYSEPLSNDVNIRVSDAVEGPWSRSRTLFTARSPLGGDEVVTDAIPHPEYSDNDGREMYVSYSRATGFPESELRLVKVRVQPTSDSGE